MKITEYLKSLDGGFPVDLMKLGFCYDKGEVYRFFHINADQALLSEIITGCVLSNTPLNITNIKSSDILDYFYENTSGDENWQVTERFEDLIENFYDSKEKENCTTPMREYFNKSVLVDLNILYLKSDMGSIYRFIFNGFIAEFWNITTGKTTAKSFSVNSNGLVSLAQLNEFFRRHPAWLNWEAAATLKELL